MKKPFAFKYNHFLKEETKNTMNEKKKKTKKKKKKKKLENITRNNHTS